MGITREEKIKGLYSLKEYLMENPIELEGHKSLPITLIDYAIEALEQWSVLDNKQEDEQKRISEIKVGDEVMTKYRRRAVAVRDTYYIGADREPLTLIWFGTHMSSYPVNDLTKTGKHYPQIAEIMSELRGAENDQRRSI